MAYSRDESASAIHMLMKMANIIDEKPDAKEVCISSKEVGLGYRAWTIKLREIIRLINDLQAEKYELKEKIRLLKLDLESRPNMEELNDKHQEEIWQSYKRLLTVERRVEDGRD